MYAGPVGWFGGAESEFAVGIRSALLGKVSKTTNMLKFTYYAVPILYSNFFFYHTCIYSCRILQLPISYYSRVTAL
jgi:hypothetical protein